MGRPSDYSQDTADAICERIAEGESLRSICRDESMPSLSSVFKWLSAQPEFADQYARGREAQADTLADEIVDIADDGKRDYVDADGVRTVDHDHIARARLRVDARKWIASKLKPKKYGERIQQEVTGKDGEALFPVLNVIIDGNGTEPAPAPEAGSGIPLKSD
jgi:hypothetical protein